MREIIEREVKKKGKKQVAYELGISLSTLTLYLQNKYPSPERIEERIRKIYANEKISCPVIGEISQQECATNYELAKKVGKMISNPEKLRLYKTCLKCEIRNG